MSYKITTKQAASGITLTEEFAYLYFVLRAAKKSLKAGMTVRIEKL